MIERDEALCDMDKAARELIRLIKRERDAASGGSSWDDVEAVLLDLREAWEGAKAYENFGV
jgi:hypothetical protein